MQTVDSSDSFLQIFHLNHSLQLVVCMGTELHTFYLRTHIIHLHQNINPRQVTTRAVLLWSRAKHNKRKRSVMNHSHRAMQTRAKDRSLTKASPWYFINTNIIFSCKDYARKMSSTDQTEIGYLTSPSITAFYQFIIPLLLITSESKTVFIVIVKLTLGIQLYSLKRLTC